MLDYTPVTRRIHTAIGLNMKQPGYVQRTSKGTNSSKDERIIMYLNSPPMACLSLILLRTGVVSAAPVQSFFS